MAKTEIINRLSSPKFKKTNELSAEQLTDPDFRLNQLEKLNTGKVPITCSKCHHCRR